MNIWDELHQRNMAERARREVEAAHAVAIASAPQDIQALQAEIEVLKGRLPPLASPAPASVIALARRNGPQTMRPPSMLPKRGPALWRLYARRRHFD
jgi:hypothetical protein